MLIKFSKGILYVFNFTLFLKKKISIFFLKKNTKQTCSFTTEINNFKDKIENVNKKWFINIWDIILRDNINDGCLFYFITFNIIDNSNPVENLKIFEQLVFKKIRLVNFTYSVIEQNKQKNYHIHSLVAVRSLISFNEFLLENINKYFRLNFNIDFVVKPLNKFLDIKSVFKYITKELDFETKGKNFITIEKEKMQFFSNFLKMLVNLEHVIEVNVTSNDYGFLNGVKVSKFSNTEEIIVNFWNYYLIINNLYLNKNGIFSKIKNSNISYEFFNTKNYLIDEFDNIFIFFFNLFPMHFENYNIYKIKLDFLLDSKKFLDYFDKITTNKIKFNYKILEFSDGVFLLEFNKFIKNSNKIKNLNIGTLKYYNKKYIHLREPKSWIEAVKSAIGEDTNNIFENLCCYLGNCILKNKTIFDKKKTLLVTGDSNTGKTTLVSKTLINYFGSENIGLLSPNNNFKFHNLIEKEIAIFDEFQYDKNFREQYLKLFSWEDIILDIKYKNDQKLKNIPMVVLSNQLLNKQSFEIQEPLLNRIFEVIFKNKVKSINEEQISNKLNIEESEIIIYWVRLLHKKLPKNSKLVINQEISNLLNSGKIK